MFLKPWLNLVIFLAFVLTLSGCATPADSMQDQQSSVSIEDPKNNQESSKETDERDPFESINRTFWHFNWEYGDKYILKPTSEFWVAYVPSPVRTGLYNAALNLNEPFSAVNNLLQLKFNRATQNTSRFLINSTLGVFGLFDVAKHTGLIREEEEFGEVLATYGVPEGPYLMLPALGPTSVRDETGDFVDSYYWPLAVIDFWPNVVRNLIIVLETRSKLSEQEALLNESLDPYEFVKNAYFQNIQYRIYDGNPPIVIDENEEEELDDLLEDF